MESRPERFSRPDHPQGGVVRVALPRAQYPACRESCSILYYTILYYTILYTKLLPGQVPHTLIGEVGGVQLIHKFLPSSLRNEDLSVPPYDEVSTFQGDDAQLFPVPSQLTQFRSFLNPLQLALIFDGVTSFL